jgi:hypothetical protein
MHDVDVFAIPRAELTETFRFRLTVIEEVHL